MGNRRTFLLLLAAVLLVAVVLVNLPRPREPQVTEQVRVFTASRDIEPYSIISPNQVALSSEEIDSDSAKPYFRRLEDVVGLMTTRFIKAGEWLGIENVNSVENVRYVEDMGLEIVSFPAIFNEMVAGQVKPGHKVNIYGYRRGSGQENPGELEWVAGNVWVVDVRTAAGAEVREEGEEAEQEIRTGIISVPRTGAGEQPASVVAVATTPEVVQDIIRAFGAKGFSAWVTLAPSPEHVVAVATPTPAPVPTAAPGPTPTVLKLDAYMTKAHGSNLRERFFESGSTVVYVAVELEHSPPVGEPKVEIDLRQGTQYVLPRQVFDHPGSGWEWYPLKVADGFESDARFTTTVYSGGRAISVEWETNAEGRTPPTGGDI